MQHEVYDPSRLERMIQEQIVHRGIRDPRVLEALRSVPRDRFFPPGAEEEAFLDRAAPIGHGQTISQPYIVALMSERLGVEPHHRVLEIGTGSGYQTAVLAKLAAEVYTIERVKPLLDAAWERLMSLNLRNVHFKYADGTAGWPECRPFDRVLIGAAAQILPEALLLDQLKEGGVAILPVGSDEQQMLVEVRRRSAKLQTTDICACRFVRLIEP